MPLESVWKVYQNLKVSPAQLAHHLLLLSARWGWFWSYSTMSHERGIPCPWHTWWVSSVEELFPYRSQNDHGSWPQSHHSYIWKAAPYGQFSSSTRVNPLSWHLRLCELQASTHTGLQSLGKGELCSRRRCDNWVFCAWWQPPRLSVSDDRHRSMRWWWLNVTDRDYCPLSLVSCLRWSCRSWVQIWWIPCRPSLESLYSL